MLEEVDQEVFTNSQKNLRAFKNPYFPRSVPYKEKRSEKIVVQVINLQTKIEEIFICKNLVEMQYAFQHYNNGNFSINWYVGVLSK